MSIKQGDFIEIEFTAKLQDSGEVFDTTSEAVAKEANLNVKQLKPFVLSVGNSMILKSLDADFVGKEVGKDYVLELSAKDAFGERQKSLVKMVPTKLFHQQKINPQRGMQLSLDGQLVRVLSNSGGRTLVDFNSPLAGKDVVYEYKVTKEVTDQKEKIEAVQEFLFRRTFDFDVEKDSVTFKVEQKIEPMVKMFAPKMKEILGLEVKTKVAEEIKK